MNKQGKETFEIRSGMEQTPFYSFTAQAFLKKWAEINDGTEIEFLGRQKWEEKKKESFFQKKENGKMILFLPEDLHLWEMVGIMEEVDRDTFAEKPERAIEKKKEMETLGKMFKNVAFYLSMRISSIQEGRAIAEALSEEFYSYGNLLSPEENREQKELTPEETTEADNWLLGENLVSSRIGEIENEEEKEKRRKETLAQFFRVTEKAFVLKNSKLSQPKMKPWEDVTPIHSAFLQKIESSIKGEIEKPKWEISGALYRRGTENLLKNLERPENKQAVVSMWSYIEKLFGEKTASSFSEQNEKLVNFLKLPELKKEMEEVRKSGDASTIGEKEREIALKIQKAVSSFRYRSDSNNPVDMIATKYINCVGSSIIGGSILSEIDIDYLVGSVPEHSFLFLVTSDRKVIWYDMLAPDLNEELKDEILAGLKKDGKPFTVSDLVDFSKKSSPSGFTFEVEGEKYKEKMSFSVERERKYVTLFPPKEGQQIQLLGNASDAFIKMGKYGESLEACRQALILSPQHPNLYNNLGYSLVALGRDKEAIIEYKKAIALDPEYFLAYNGIAQALFDLGNFFEAKETFEKSININSLDCRAHLGLGLTFSQLDNHNQDAEREFRESISLDDRLSVPHFYLAELLKKEDRNIEAVIEYERFLARADEKKDVENIERAKEAIKKIKS